MTKKHFIALADTLREHNQRGRRNTLAQRGSELNPEPFSAAQIQTLADFCQSQNYRFNRARWLAYIAGECGPNGGRK